jgi:hypothetical protein
MSRANTKTSQVSIGALPAAYRHASRSISNSLPLTSTIMPNASRSSSVMGGAAYGYWGGSGSAPSGDGPESRTRCGERRSP